MHIELSRVSGGKCCLAGLDGLAESRSAVWAFPSLEIRFDFRIFRFIRFEIRYCSPFYCFRLLLFCTLLEYRVLYTKNQKSFQTTSEWMINDHPWWSLSAALSRPETWVSSREELAIVAFVLLEMIHSAHWDEPYYVREFHIFQRSLAQDSPSKHSTQLKVPSRNDSFRPVEKVPILSWTPLRFQLPQSRPWLSLKNGLETSKA